MWSMFSNSLQLFLKGKLFRDPAAVFRQWLIGFVITVVGVVGLVMIGAPVAISVIVVAVIVGAAQPYLFKNLKYA